MFDKVPVRRFARLVLRWLHNSNPLARGGSFLHNILLGGFDVWKKIFNRAQSNLRNSVSTSHINKETMPKHIAIIMDGNGRWAKKQGLPRTFGHQAGAEALRTIVKTCSQLGIQVLTAYAFSTENWKRPHEEVNFLMRLLSDYLDNEIDELNEKHVKIQFIGDLTELADQLQKKIIHAQTVTNKNNGLILNLAVNYGGRMEIIRSVQQIADKVRSGELESCAIDDKIITQHLYTTGLPDPDILIRPGGDFRISNFLLWQLAYTELWFTDICWPDFKPEHLIQAIQNYQQRERRFGGLKHTK